MTLRRRVDRMRDALRVLSEILGENAECLTCTEAEAVRSLFDLAGLEPEGLRIVAEHQRLDAECVGHEGVDPDADCAPMRSHFVTFGVQYAHEPHPRCAWVHPDGWLRIEAQTEQDARLAAVDLLGSAWSMCYTPSDEDEWRDSIKFFPRGELAVLDDGVLTVHETGGRL